MKPPKLRGKYYETPGQHGPVLCLIVAYQLGTSRSGVQFVDTIKVQQQKWVNGRLTWTTPRWIKYGRHIARRILAYEAQSGGAA